MNSSSSSSSADIENRTLYVGGLDESVDESLLQAAFIPFGDIVEVEVAREPKTGAHKGYGFVSYEAVEDAAAAVENMNHSEMFGRVLRVSFARAGSGNGGAGGSASGSAERRRPVWEGEGYYEAKAAAEEEEEEAKGKRVVYKSVQNEGEGFSTEGADEGGDGDGANVKRVFFAPQGMK